ncbi:MAG: DUF1963 domain-containing protein [Burkholderiaceae bacterium]|jgi:uncharacterized protein YwqG|nr:DUF1963 domain-containing protein [Burkholderiaceae bacterium]
MEQQVPADKTALPEPLAGCIAQFKVATAIPMLQLTTQEKRTGPLDSKFGGVPYLPPGFDYPRVRTGDLAGRPLRLLAQLNFSQLPALPDFPRSGILQFFIADGSDGLHGADFNNPTDQNAFRVVYQADTTRPHQESALPGFDLENSCFPIKSPELSLDAALGSQAMPAEDLRFWMAFKPYYQAARGVGQVSDADDEPIYWALTSGGGHRLGGYPYFTIDDPRYSAPSLAAHTTLLLQIDSEFGEKRHRILWGDTAGITVFLIEPQRLRALDFSNVLYSWDCC